MINIGRNNTQPQQPVPHVANQQDTQNLYDGVLANATYNIVALRAVEVPATNPLHHKPIEIDASHLNIMNLQNATHGGHNINEAALRKVARDIVKPSDQSHGQICISGGWNQSRYAVFMMVDTTINGRTYRDILTLYTPEADPSLSGLFDKNLPLFVNSHLRVTMAPSAGPAGSVMTPQVGQNSQVLSPVTIMQGNQQIVGQFGTRPTDMFTNMQRANRNAATTSVDFRGTMDDSNSLTSFRNNALSSKFMSKLLTGWSRASNSIDDGMSNNMNYMIGAAADEIAESDYSVATLFAALNHRTSYGVANFFTLNELSSFANINWNDFHVVHIPRGQLTNLAAETQGWGDYSLETRLAHRIAHVIPSLATDGLMATLSISAAGSSNGEHIVSIEGFNPMFETPMDAQLIAVIKQKLEHAILPEIMQDMCGFYTIQLSFTVGGSVDMKLSLDGQPEVPYSAPNYCDALASSCIAIDQNHVLEQGRSVGELVTNTFVNTDAAIATSY